MGKRLADGLSAIARKSGLKACVNRIGSLVCLFFGIDGAHDYKSVKVADTERYAKYFRGMLDSGVYLAPSQFEAMFVSAAHSERDIDETLDRAESLLKKN
ncbi:glutamate-1-semialdehyde aminotransferase [Fibrobacteres bacterium R8-0-B4]